MTRNPDDRRPLPRAHKLDAPRVSETSIAPSILTHRRVPPLLQFSAKKPAPIIVSDGDKGGVGKSHVSRLLAYILTINGLSWRGFDLDPMNGNLERFHLKDPVKRLNWLEPSQWELLYQGIVDADPAQVVLIDLPAQSGLRAFAEYPRLNRTASHLNRSVLRCWTLAPLFDSVNLFYRTLDAVEGSHTFAILNLRGVHRSDFKVMWDDCDTRKSLLASGGFELCLPQLSTSVANRMDAEDYSFLEALTALKEPWFVYDIEAYLAAILSEFAPIVGRLG